MRCLVKSTSRTVFATATAHHGRTVAKTVQTARNCVVTIARILFAEFILFGQNNFRKQYSGKTNSEPPRARPTSFFPGVSLQASLGPARPRKSAALLRLLSYPRLLMRRSYGEPSCAGRGNNVSMYRSHRYYIRSIHRYTIRIVLTLSMYTKIHQLMQ